MNLTFNVDDFECVQTMAAFERWMKACNKAKSVCFDTEGTGLDTRRDEIVGFALSVIEGSEAKACYIPVGHTEGKQLSIKKVLPPIKKLLESGKPIVGANLLFDMLMMAQPRYDTVIANAHDTQLMSFALTGNQHFAHGMDALAERVLGYETIKFAELVKPDKVSKAGKVTVGNGVENFSFVRLDTATKYSAEDAAVTLVIAKILEKQLKAAGLWRVYNEIDRPLLPVLRDMKLAGVKVDLNVLDELRGEWMPLLEELKVTAHAQAGFVFNLRSTQDKAHLLYDPVAEGGLGVKCEHFTDKGGYSTDKEALKAIPGVPVVETLLEFNKYDKLVSTYVNGLPEAVDPDTGRVHTDLKITTVKTRRFASAGPNLQNIPSRDERGERMREAFIAEKGNLLISADYSQIEYRILAHAAQCKYLMHAFHNKIDMHAKMAADAKGGSWEDYNNKDDKVRYRMRGAFKNVNFAVNYGAGAALVAAMSKIEVAEAYMLLEMHQELCPEVYDWKEATIEFAQQHGYVENLFGGRTWTRFINSRKSDMRSADERLACNAPIQGGSAELIRLAMPRVHKAIRPYKAKMLLQVHDELVIECAKHQAEECAFDVQQQMELAGNHMINWSVPILAETGIGKNWKEAK